MKTEDYERRIKKLGLKPIEVIISARGEVKWFVCRDRDKIVLYDADGYAYSATAKDDSTGFVFDGTPPTYKGEPMTPAPSLNI